MLTGFDLCRAVLAVTDVSAPEQSVLMVLAIMADRDDATCFPPVTGPTGLTTKTKLSERSVQRAIQNLVALGHISRRQLRHGCVYTVHPRAASTPATVTGDSVTGDTVTGDTVTPATQAARGATVAPKQPVTTISPDADASVDREPAPAPRQRARQLPVDWTPEPFPEGSDLAAIVAAWRPGMLERVLSSFGDHWRGNGKRMVDWQATWRNWVRREDGNGRDQRRGQRAPQRQHGCGYRDPLLAHYAGGGDPGVG